MQRLPAVSATLALAAIVIVAGCGKPAGGANAQATTVAMTVDNFVNNDASYTLKAGHAIAFADPANTGGLHILCFGKNGRCDKSITTGPKDLQGDGFQINASQSRLVTLGAPGTYPITCSIHPIMQITIVVQ